MALAELYAHPHTKAKSPTEVIVGTDVEGHTYTVDLAEAVHLLLAGTTGSGKSVYILQILISLMLHNTPETLKIVRIDPKPSEGKPYEGLAFCPVDPIYNMADGYGLMAAMVQLMEKRLMQQAYTGSVTVPAYNEFVTNPENKQRKLQLTIQKMMDEGVIPRDATPAQVKEALATYQWGIDKPMARWVVLIDEYADMSMQEKETEDVIVRIAQKARSVGIHLIVATQKPVMQVISTLIKSNLPSRIGLTTTGYSDSMVIMDEPGCEKLHGKGDSLVKITGMSNPERIQGVYITDEERDRFFASIRETFGPPKPFDYMPLAVESGYCEWADPEDAEKEIGDETRHVKRSPKKRSSSF